MRAGMHRGGGVCVTLTAKRLRYCTFVASFLDTARSVSQD